MSFEEIYEDFIHIIYDPLFGVGERLTDQDPSEMTYSFSLYDLAKALCILGYHKQSKWISVEERLPKECGKYLVCTQRGNVYQTKFYSYPENKGGHWGQKDKGRSITHWMPLPEAPKMKGGAE